jgi:hypothetical protein
MLPPALVIRSGEVSLFGDRHSLWWRAEHMVGSGSVFVVDTNIVLTGTLGEGPAGFERGLVFSRGFFWG